MNSEHIDSWKNRDVFVQQLSLNISQFQNEWPAHWHHFVDQATMVRKRISRVIDIGCGCGAYSMIVAQEFEDVQYIGYDYSKEAVDLANESFGEIGSFYNKSYQDIKWDDIFDNDLIVVNGLIDILPNGNECLEHILSICANMIILQRIPITKEKSNSEVYQTPYGIKTYKFSYNKSEFLQTIKKNGYTIFKWDTFGTNPDGEEDSVDVLLLKDLGAIENVSSGGCCG